MLHELVFMMDYFSEKYYQCAIRVSPGHFLPHRRGFIILDHVIFIRNVAAVSKYLKPQPNICGSPISLTGVGIPFQAAILATKNFFRHFVKKSKTFGKNINL